MRFLRYFYVLSVFLTLPVASCYAPITGPEIYGDHISCHWNGGYGDYMWIFQAWVYHPISADEVRETNIFLWDSQGNKNYIPLKGSSSTLWEDIPIEADTNLECNKWYLVEIITFDNQGLYDYVETSYQK